jgi:hypothetical protein
MSLRFLLVSTLFLGATLSQAQAQSSIGINFGAERADLAPDDLVGVVEQRNWNNAKDPEGTFSNLVNSEGVATKAEATWTAKNTWTYSKKVDDARDVLYSGYLDGGTDGRGAEVSITGVPFRSYDVYIYVNAGWKNTTSSYKVNNEERTVTPGHPPEDFVEAAECDRARPDPEAAGNYLVFKDVTGDLLLQTDNWGTDNAESGDFRSPICAVQLVEKK